MNSIVPSTLEFDSMCYAISMHMNSFQFFLAYWSWRESCWISLVNITWGNINCNSIRDNEFNSKFQIKIIIMVLICQAKKSVLTSSSTWKHELNIFHLPKCDIISSKLLKWQNIKPISVESSIQMLFGWKAVLTYTIARHEYYEKF